MHAAPATPDDGIAALLRGGTAQAHRNAERSPFVIKLLRGEAGVPALTAFLAQLLPVYEAMEERLRAGGDDPVLGPVVLPDLYRVDALRADLETLNGHDTPITAETQALVDRVRSNTATQLVAHAYTRYLGDLSGGQTIGAAIVKRYGVEPLAFFDFSHIDDHSAYKDMYRSRLDGLPLDADGVNEIVSEAILAFDMNRDLMTSVLGLV